MASSSIIPAEIPGLSGPWRVTRTVFRSSRISGPQCMRLRRSSGLPCASTTGSIPRSSLRSGNPLSQSSFRLPRHILPEHYDIRLDLDFENFTFTGKVGIDLEVKETAQEIVLNAAEIEIKEAFLSSGDGRVPISGVAYDEELGRATLSLDEPLIPGSYRLEIDYT